MFCKSCKLKQQFKKLESPGIAKNLNGFRKQIHIFIIIYWDESK